MDKLYYTNDINDACGALRYKNRFLKENLREKKDEILRDLREKGRMRPPAAFKAGGFAECSWKVLL